MAAHTEPSEWPLWRKTSLTRAVQIHSPADLPGGKWRTTDEGFYVRTYESNGTTGDLFALWGSWLAQDARGYFYPIADEEFRQIYEPVDVDSPDAGPDDGRMA